MSFAIYRKYEKPLLWFAVVFTVVVFATFSGLGDFNRLLDGTAPDAVGRFRVLSTGERVEVRAAEFEMVHRRQSRLRGRNAEFGTDQVWLHLMNLADAQGAGLEVSDAELAQYLTAGSPEMARLYHDPQTPLYRQLGFSSKKELERTVRETLLVGKWIDFSVQKEKFVGADEVYLRWRQDHELFDMEAVVIADFSIDEIADPTEDVAQAWFEDMPEAQRAFLFKEPATFDIAYTALPMDFDLASLSPEILSGLEEPNPDDLTARFQRVRFVRAPEATEPDEVLKEALKKEVQVIDLVRSADTAFAAIEEGSLEQFKRIVEEAGLTFSNPDGLLGSEALSALDPMEDESLHLRLGGRKAGEVIFVEPWGDQKAVSLIFVEEATEDRPLTFPEALEQIGESWKKEQIARRGEAFRVELNAAVRALPEVVELVEPMREIALETAEARIESAEGETPLDESSKEEWRAEELARIEPQIAARVAEFEYRVWDSIRDRWLGQEAGVEVLTILGSTPNYAQNPGSEDDAESTLAFLKRHPAPYAQAVNGITEELRDGKNESSALVRVISRNFPEKEAMLMDGEGMDEARRALGNQAQSQARSRYFDYGWISSEHELELLTPDEDGAN